MATKGELDFSQLSESYDILGRLAGRDDARTVLATRRSDGLPVLIAAQREPAGDEGNALSHLASDAKLLADSRHPVLVRVLGSHWLGNDALAIVTDRIAAPSLEDRLSRREEEFPFPRVALILREVNAALEWAREKGVVHRAVRPDTVFLEDGSDRVQVLFVAAALPANGIPDESDDARTVAALARAMLTRSVADPERDRQPLAELRPGLPSRVVQQTEALLGRAESLEPVDVRSYVASIAMAEEVKQGEDELERVTRELTEAQRVTREELAAERKAHEEDLAEQAKKFAEEREGILKAMAREREESARALARERDEGEKALTRDRDDAQKQLTRERERFEKEVQKQRARLEKEQARLARERESFEKERAKAREQIAAKLAALREQADLYAQTSELPVPPIPPALLEPLPEPDPVALAPEPVDDEPADEPADEPQTEPIEPLPVTEPAGLPPRRSAPRAAGGTTSPANPQASRTRRLRHLGFAAIALVLVVAVAALAFGRRGDARPAAAAAQVRVVDSLAGTAAPSILDSTALVGLDSAPLEYDPNPAPVRRVRTPAPAPEPVDTAAVTTVAQPDTMLVPDLGPPAPFNRVDSPAPAPAQRSDSVSRDTTAPRDTVRREPPRRDTVVTPRRDTVPVRPDTIPNPT